MSGLILSCMIIEFYSSARPSLARALNWIGNALGVAGPVASQSHHFIWTVEDRKIDLGYLSVGFYTEMGNNYSSGNFRVGSAWKF